MISKVSAHSISEVRSLIGRHIAQSLSSVAGRLDTVLLVPGKMLRSRLSLRLYHGMGGAGGVSVLFRVTLPLSTGYPNP